MWKLWDELQVGVALRQATITSRTYSTESPRHKCARPTSSIMMNWNMQCKRELMFAAKIVAAASRHFFSSRPSPPTLKRNTMKKWCNLFLNSWIKVSGHKDLAAIQLHPMLVDLLVAINRWYTSAWRCTFKMELLKNSICNKGDS